jgi:hypothetical protein
MSKTSFVLGAVALAAASCFGAWGCTFLLDIDSLQKGSGAQTQDAQVQDVQGEQDSSQPSDAGEEADAVDAAPEAAPKNCTGDLDCTDPTNPDLCNVYKCDLDSGTCGAPVPYEGPVIQQTATFPVLSGLEGIGVPSLIANEQTGDVYLAVYTKDLPSKQNIEFRHFDPALSTAAQADFVSLLGANYSEPVSNVALLPLLQNGADPAIGVLAAATATGTLTTCMRRLFLGLDFKVSNINTECLSPGTEWGDYHRAVPRMFRQTGTKQITAMWLQGAALTFAQYPAVGAWDTITPRSVSLQPGRIRSFAPYAGVGTVFGAILEGGPVGKTDDRTYDWNVGFGDTISSPLQPATAGDRYGVAIATLSPAASPAQATTSIVAWTHPTADLASTIDGLVVSCSGTACNKGQFSGAEAGGTTATFSPYLASETLAQPDAFMGTRFTVAGGVFGAMTPDQSGGQTLLWASFLSGDAQDGGIGSAVNPPFMLVSTNTVTATAGLKLTNADLAGAMGRATALVTPSGNVYIAWVQHDSASNKESLTLRRYQIKANCH